MITIPKQLEELDTAMVIRNVTNLEDKLSHIYNKFLAKSPETLERPRNIKISTSVYNLFVKIIGP